MRILIAMLLILSLSTPLYGAVDMDKDEEGHYLGLYDKDIQDKLDEVAIECAWVIDLSQLEYEYKGKRYKDIKDFILEIVEDD